MRPFTPLVIALICAGVMVMTRLITNHYCSTRLQEIIAAGTTSGFIPAWVSIFYLLGIVGLFATSFWSFFSIGWWAPIAIFALYLLTGLVPSSARDMKLMMRCKQPMKPSGF